MNTEIIQLEEALIKKASNLLKDNKIKESMKFYTLLLDLPWGQYCYNISLMIKMAKYYLEIGETIKALDVINRAEKISTTDIKVLQVKKAILESGKINTEEYKKVLERIKESNKQIDDWILLEYLEKVKDTEFVEENDVSNKLLKEYLSKSTDEDLSKSYRKRSKKEKEIVKEHYKNKKMLGII